LITYKKPLKLSPLNGQLILRLALLIKPQEAHGVVVEDVALLCFAEEVG
jgi:hypothetical protein